MDITEPQWQLSGPLLPVPPVRDDGRRRPWRDPRDVLSGILWVLRTGAPWAELPERYPPYQTCHRRFQAWVDRAGKTLNNGGATDSLPIDWKELGEHLVQFAQALLPSVMSPVARTQQKLRAT